MKRDTSKQLFAEAEKSIPGGVNSPVRAFKSVGGTPVFMAKAKGAYMYDVDGNQYIDYISSWGPMILGHAFEPVVQAIQNEALNGTSYGAPTQLEVEMAALVKQMAPNIDLIRMVNSGTEACMSAIRLARGYTGRNKIIKFDGCYHGHADSFLIKAGSGVATEGIQHVPGITKGVSEDTLVAEYNDADAVQKLVDKHRNEIAAIIVEPIAGNMGCVLPEKEFLQNLRDICYDNNIVLIFDEVMTGFRLAPGGAQAALGIEADLVTYGKIIGGGLPVGAFGGKEKIMKKIAPLGEVYQAGTLSGNPLAMVAGYTMLKHLQQTPQVYQQLEEKAQYLVKNFTTVLQQKNIPFVLNHFGSMMSLHFSEEPITNFTTASKQNFDLFRKMFHFMLNEGIYLPPSGYEAWFLNNALSYDDMDKTVDTLAKYLKTV